MTKQSGRTEPWGWILQRQDGVIARWQLSESGASESEIRRILRRRLITRLHAGVYVAHTGLPTWEQRAWAAVLACWPSALAGRSALRPPDPSAPITIAVQRGRNVVAPAGVIVLHRTNYDNELMRNAHPPRQRTAYAAIDAVDSLNDAAAYGLIADLIQRAHTTPEALRAALGSRSRVRRRRLLQSLVDDVATGACSVLEREYLHRVERAHGLPRGQRQAPDNAGGIRARRDVLYPPYGLIVELDGAAFHNSAAARDRDAARDLAAAVERSQPTVRLTAGQVLSSPCTIARSVGTLLHRAGWEGHVIRCPQCATVRRAATG